jgi:hypothetical protein
MRIKVMTMISIVALVLMLTTGCGENAASKNESTDASPASEPKAPAAASSTDASTSSPPPRLLGVYVLSEVQNKGQVNMVTPANATEFTFLADGNYSRQSKIGGKVDHTDSGQFSVEGPDQLVLHIQLSDNRIQVPPVEKKHSITLSADGEELSMKGNEGKVAVFRRKKATEQ